jgi:N-acyl-D-amino-acid deacylase
MVDILIRNAEIVDGTSAPSYRGDIGIEGDHIVDIGSLESVAAKTVIDATGRAVVPGFIDMHSHADLSLLAAPEAESLVHQGITTVVTGQCGISPAPLTGQSREDTLATLNTFASSEAPIPWDEISSFGSFLRVLVQLRPSVNVVPLVGQGMIRAAVLGYSADPPTEDQMKQMQRLVREAMDSGAFGISTGLIYPPGSFTSTEELIEVVRPVSEWGGLYFSHARGEKRGVVDAYGEAIEIGRKTGAAVEISHFKAAGRENWDQAALALELIDGARSGGLNVTADMYPYLAGATYLAALLPEWAMEGGLPGLLKRLTRAPERARIIDAMKAGEGGIVENIEWDGILISRSSERDYEARYVSELASGEGKEPYEWTLDALLKTQGDISMVAFLMSEHNVKMQLRHPAMLIGTDGLGLATEGPMASGTVHPRNFGTFPRVFGRYVREEGVLALEEASWKASGYPAQKLGLADRGMIRRGYKADLVVFDPTTIRDEATYMEPLQYPSGLEYVLVNGEVVIEQGRQTSARPGTVIRRGA